MRVVGIDPSLTGTGIAWSTGTGYDCTTIGRDGITTLPLPERVAALDGLLRDIRDCLPLADLYLIEEHVAFGMKTTAGQMERGVVWWSVYRRLIRAGVPVAVVNPFHLKIYATGKSKAPKTAVVDAVARRFPMFTTRGNDNAADAAVLCAMGCEWVGRPIADLPQDHRRALTKVNWPAGFIAQGLHIGEPVQVHLIRPDAPPVPLF